MKRQRYYHAVVEASQKSASSIQVPHELSDPYAVVGVDHK
jgi:hypothetical protein